MKKQLFIILGLFLFIFSAASAVQKVYLQKGSRMPNYNYNYYNRPYRPVYNPYTGRYNPYYSSPYYSNNNIIRRINRANTLRRLERQRLRNTWGNYLSWNKNKNGALSGYSVPINDDIYQQMGITPYNKAPKQSPKSPNCQTDLFSSPQGDEMYYTNGEKNVDLRGATGKTGVTIIYD